MNSQEIRHKFFDFFKKKGHQIVPSSSLLPDDQSVLFTTAGMQQFTPYFTGEIKPPYKRACSGQKCFRVNDIEEVGDKTHHTFFEMLGNWSFGDYFKEEAINYALEFLTKECGLAKDRLWVTIFQGDKDVPKDEESFRLWLKAGIPQERIFAFGAKDNFWGPVASTGPCGPCSEIHYDLTGKACSLGEKCGPNCQCGRFVEIWNLVFMEYRKKVNGLEYEYIPLPQKNIDTGIGFERLTAILQNKESAYQTDLFFPLMEEVRRIAPDQQENINKQRIIADHLRAVCFLIADGVLPSNVEQGYILRRILRRIIGQGRFWKLEKDFLYPLVEKVIEIYKDNYPELAEKHANILEVIQKEEEKFSQTIEKGIKHFEKIAKKDIGGQEAFNLFSTYGLPLEMIKDLSDKKGLKIDKKGFEKAYQKHQKLSRVGAEKKFGGHGLGETRIFSEADQEKVKRLHTATHLLHQALQDVLGNEVRQMGSDINPERLRFDFSYSDKMTPEQIKQVENIVNQKIEQDLPIKCEEMNKEKAIKSGAKAFFKNKYGEKVKVYSIGDYSLEICGGPHVKSTRELGHFKIKKEQSSSAGVRRIKAILE